MQRYRIARELAEGAQRGQESGGIERKSLTQAQASKRPGIAQPHVSQITRGKIELLSLDYLVGLCAKAGLTVRLEIAA